MHLPTDNAFNEPCKPGPVRLRIRVAGIIVQDEKLLVTGYSINAHRFFSLPGGGQEYGETAEQALRRELDEETALKLEDCELAYVAETFFPDPFDAEPLHLIGLYFRAKVSGESRLGFVSPDSPEASIMDELRWVSRKELKQLPLYPEGLSAVLEADWQSCSPAHYLRLPATENRISEQITGRKPWRNGKIRPRAAGILFDEQGRLLIMEGSQHLALPGGGVEADELIPAALVREIEEECGLIVETERLLFVNDNRFRDPTFFGDMPVHELGFYWTAKVVGGRYDPTPRLERAEYGEDTIRLIWMTIDEIAAGNFYPRWLLPRLQELAAGKRPEGTLYSNNGFTESQ